MNGLKFFCKLLVSTLLCISVAVGDQKYQDIYIQSAACGKVLDARGDILTIYDYTGQPSQLWQLEPTPIGSFFIHNKLTGNVLDAVNGVALIDSYLATNPQKVTKTQEWYIQYNGLLENADYSLAIDITESNYTNGASVILFDPRGTENQLWTLRIG